jgi:hypothetical protein
MMADNCVFPKTAIKYRLPGISHTTVFEPFRQDSELKINLMYAYEFNHFNKLRRK